jgi:hypothetical protein
MPTTLKMTAITWIVWTAFAATVFTATVPCLAQNMAASRTAEARIAAVVQRHFASDTSFVAGDLISRSDVEPIINELLDLGFRPNESEELYDAILPDNDRLVRLLKNPHGIKFMRQISSIPGVYDRLERLSWTESGRQLIDSLIERPDGPQLLKNLIAPGGAKAVEQIFAGDSRGANFQRPTGHVHTAPELLQRLLASYSQPVTN